MRFLQSIIGGVADLGRVFLGDKAAEAVQTATTKQAVLSQFAAEFAHKRQTWFDVLVDGLNRLPRPILVFSTIGLFVYAMRDPVGFAARMVGLAHIPEPLWWLLGGIIGFYFRAREMNHARAFRAPTPDQARATVQTIRDLEAIRAGDPLPDDLEAPPTENPAILDFKKRDGGLAYGGR